MKRLWFCLLLTLWLPAQALQITDELFRERGGAEQLAGDLRRLASEVRPLLPPAKRGDDTDH